MLTIFKTNPLALLILTLVFLVGINVLSFFGIPKPIFFLLIFFLCFLSINKIKRRVREIPEALHFLLFAIGYWLFKMYIDRTPGAIMNGILVFTPVLVYLTLTSLIPINKRDIYKQILYICYMIECGIAIIERLTKQLIFGLRIEDEIIMSQIDNVIDFRSNALFGHPLQNALIVLVFILFILLYESNLKLKFSLAIIGIISIFCFNTRAAIAISCSVFVVYLFYWLKTTSIPSYKKFFIIFIFILGSIYLISLFNSGAIGGRLLSMGLYDDSSAAGRLRIWELFNYLEPSSFIIGQDYYSLERMMYKFGVRNIENYWLIWFFSYGLIFIVFIFILYWRLFARVFKCYSIFDKFFLIVPFLICATTNNSLAVCFVPASAFLVLSYIFGPSNKQK